MIEFSRRHQEDKLVKEQEDELRQLTEDEVDLEVGLLLNTSINMSYCKQVSTHSIKHN